MMYKLFGCAIAIVGENIRSTTTTLDFLRILLLIKLKITDEELYGMQEIIRATKNGCAPNASDSSTENSGGKELHEYIFDHVPRNGNEENVTSAATSSDSTSVEQF
mmetsp:Transcript_24635/g.36784  ORF Transcript_24635/g.36784 Transcript_24635/m.36784 type:complete len:106 (-) Transcript_24635:194-511(-)